MYLPVWNPNKAKDERIIRDLTIDFIGDESRVEDSSPMLARAFAKSDGTDHWATDGVEQHVARNLHKFVRDGIVCDAMCLDFGITDVASLRSRLRDDDFEPFPL
jgi:hypothetical protein